MKDINFKQKDGLYIADFVSEGACIIQVDNKNVEPLKSIGICLIWNQVLMM